MATTIEFTDSDAQKMLYILNQQIAFLRPEITKVKGRFVEAEILGGEPNQYFVDRLPVLMDEMEDALHLRSVIHSAVYSTVND
jgi:hypothetical protein